MNRLISIENGGIFSRLTFSNGECQDICRRSINSVRLIGTDSEPNVEVRDASDCVIAGFVTKGDLIDAIKAMMPHLIKNGLCVSEM